MDCSPPEAVSNIAPGQLVRLGDHAQQLHIRPAEGASRWLTNWVTSCWAMSQQKSPTELERSTLEAQSDAFAAELLMPAADARRELRTVDSSGSSSSSSAGVSQLLFSFAAPSTSETISPAQRKSLEIELSTNPGGGAGARRIRS